MRHRVVFSLVAVAGALAGWPPASAQAVFTTYHCRDGSEFIAAFYDGDKRAHLQLDGKAIALTKRVSLRGARYVRRDVTLRIAKAGVTLKRGKHSTECTAD